MNVNRLIIKYRVHLEQIVNINGQITINKTKARMDFKPAILSENTTDSITVVTVNQL